MNAPHGAIAPLGLRLPPAARPTEAWGPWTVVARAHGFHVSRESANGARTEALTNEVGRTKIFRSAAKAQLACSATNFDATAQRLRSEPLLGGKAAQ